MFTLYETGHIVKSNTKTNPCTIVKDYLPGKLKLFISICIIINYVLYFSGSIYTCLEIYEYVINDLCNDATTLSIATETPMNVETVNNNENPGKLFYNLK